MNTRRTGFGLLDLLLIAAIATLLAAGLTFTFLPARAGTPEPRPPSFVLLGATDMPPATPAVERAIDGSLLLPDPQFVATLSEPWIVEAARSHPWLVMVLTAMGSLRLLFKPAMGVWQTVVQNTPGTRDDELFARVNRSGWFRAFAWLLDYGASIKLPSNVPAGTAKATARAGLFFLAILPVALAATGCTTAKTVVSKDASSETVQTNGVVVRVASKEVTSTTARTVADGKNKLSDFKAGQTATSQKIGIGEQSGESTGEVVGTMMNGLMFLGRLAAMTQGVPYQLPAPAAPPQVVTLTNYVTLTNAPAKAAR